MPTYKCLNLHGVYTEDERGNWSLSALYTDEAEAQAEALRIESHQPVVVTEVPVLTSEQRWRHIFRQGSGKE